MQASRAWPSLAGLVPHLPGPVPEPGYAHYHAPHHAVPGYSPAHLDPLQYPANTFAPGMVTPPVSLANVPRWVLAAHRGKYFQRLPNNICQPGPRVEQRDQHDVGAAGSAALQD